MDAVGQRPAHVGVGEPEQRRGQGAPVAGGHEEAVDPVGDLPVEGGDGLGEHRQAVGVGEGDVVRGGRRAGGHDEHVVVDQQGREGVGRHGSLAQLDPGRERGVGAGSGEDGANGPAHRARDRQGDVGCAAHRPHEPRDDLRVADGAEGEQPGRAGAAAPRARATSRHGRREVRDADAAGTEVVGEPGLLGVVDEDGVDPREQVAHGGGLTRARPVRERRVADDDGLRPGPGRCVGGQGVGGQGAGGPQQGEVGGCERWHGLHDDDGVERAQAAPDPHPRVGPRPAERPDRAGERRHLRHRRARVDHAPQVRAGGGQVGPRDEHDVVPGVAQVVGERRRVGGHRPGVRVRRPDDRDAQSRVRRRGCRRRTALPARSAPPSWWSDSSSPGGVRARTPGGEAGRAPGATALPLTDAERRRVAGGAALRRGHRHR